jgi:hypothetical protein
MTTPDRLVTFDNNILIDLRENNEPIATSVRQLLDFNRAGKITISTTTNTMLEKQRTGKEMSLQELIAWLQELGFTSEHIFMEPRTMAFNVQCIHYAIFPTIPFHWRDNLHQQCAERGIEGRRLEALIELDNKRRPYIPHSPQALQQRPTPALDTLEQDELEELSDIYMRLHWNWMNKKNDALGLYNHLTNAIHTTYPDQSIFVTCDKHFFNKDKAIRQCGFRGEILRPADAVAFIKRVIT